MYKKFAPDASKIETTRLGETSPRYAADLFAEGFNSQRLTLGHS